MTFEDAAPILAASGDTVKVRAGELAVGLETLTELGIGDPAADVVPRGSISDLALLPESRI
jgi:hypothetical protein